MAEETTPTPETTPTDDPKAAKLEGETIPHTSEAKPKAPKEAKGKPVAAEATEKPVASKKPKEPAIEDKPFQEFMEQNFTPALKAELLKEGIDDIELTFKKDKLSVAGTPSPEQIWQVKGSWQNGQRQFNLYFPDEDIAGKKAFSCAVNGVPPSTIESFMIDERKVTLDLMVRYTLQRLNGQKWLTRN